MRKILQKEIIFNHFLLFVDGIRGFLVISVYKLKKIMQSDIIFAIILLFVDEHLILSMADCRSHSNLTPNIVCGSNCIRMTAISTNNNKAEITHLNKSGFDGVAPISANHNLMERHLSRQITI